MPPVNDTLKPFFLKKVWKYGRCNGKYFNRKIVGKKDKIWEISRKADMSECTSVIL